MNNWFKKYEKLITILVIAGFLAGIVWWSIATYLSSKRSQSLNQDYTFSKESSVLVITKDGIELEYPYWIMKDEVNSLSQQQAQLYQLYYGQKLDPVFDYLILKNQIVDMLYDQRLIQYYAEQNNLLPDAKSLNSALNNLKSNENNWNTLINYYGSEEAVKSLLALSLLENNVLTAVASISREEALKYIEENFDNIKYNYEQIKVQHILVSDENTANQVKDDIINGKITFEEAASLYSQDTSNATSSGDLGWIKHGELEETFEAAAFNANKGEIVGPIETSYGFHLIRVTDKKVFENPQDVFLYEDVYSEIENTLQEEKFQEWLANYKREENFGRNYYDTKLLYVHMIYSLDLDEKSKENLAKELENIIFDGDDISLEVDSDYLAIYTLLTTDLLNSYYNHLSILNNYISFSQKVDPNIASLGLEQINKKIEELNQLLNEGDEITDEKIKYETARDFLNAEDLVEDLGIHNLEEAETFKSDLENKLEKTRAKLTKVLADLFAQYPSSSSVVQLYYQLNPQDLKVKVKYSELQMNQLKQYINYLGPQYLFMFFQQPINEILVNVQSVIDSEEAEISIKLEALEVGLDLTEMLELDDLKLYYLEKIKEIDPEYYSDIDKLIEDTRKSIEESTKSASELESELETQ
ncbi:MAG TPA: peptidylprolyl isomerase [Defluviitoga sp.]|nr:peptidylprolyl isomerase [Defluviitoga sp.]HOP23813.1 peptidylprolyl isomerase [Defluviitoga sp.]HPZ28440.1 peptidylprolyl isomerase [Defluviitoga sp.]HQD62826.1 peptidylprolyl isomerase [Defluviitoga sp.]